MKSVKKITEIRGNTASGINGCIAHVAITVSYITLAQFCNVEMHESFLHVINFDAKKMCFFIKPDQCPNVASYVMS